MRRQGAPGALAVFAAVAALSILWVPAASRVAWAAAESPVAQPSYEDRKDDFIVQTRSQVQNLRSQFATFRRQVGKEGNLKFDAAQKDFETKAQALTQMLDDASGLSPQQAKNRKPEVDAALQAVLTAYDEVVKAIK